MSVFKILTTVALAVVYVVAAALNSELSKSPVAISVMTVLLLTTCLQMAMSKNADIFEPIKIVAFYFTILFVVAPLATREIGWHYIRPFHETLPFAAACSLAAFLFTMGGYHLVGLRYSGDSTRPFDRTTLPHPGSRVLVVCGLLSFFVGFVGYSILFIRAGGLATILFSDTSRTEFFLDFGYLFWVASFMFPGAIMLFAGMKERRGPAKFARFAPAGLAFFLFLVLQGRSRAINALVVTVFASHYLLGRVRLSQLGRWGIAVISLAIFVGIARSGELRSYAASNPLAIAAEIASNLPEVVSHFVVNDLSRLRQVVLILDKVPQVDAYDWGSSIFEFLNPWLRLVGLDHLVLEPIGPRLFHLALPHLPHLNTGFLPSMLGELLFNFPWYLAIPSFFIFGIFLRFIYQKLILEQPTRASIAIYAAIMTWVAQMLLSSIGKSIFELMIWIVPIAIAATITLAERSTANPLSAAESNSNEPSGDLLSHRTSELS